MILDSTFLVDVLRRDEAAHGYLEAAEGRAEPLRVPSVCLFELWDGAERARSPAEEQEAMAAVLDGCDLLPLEPRHARRAGSLGGALARKGVALDSLDLLIAGTAVEERERVLTRNLRDFRRIPGVRVETY